ncbi:FtsX-like permease family protein [Peribacillus tepidiphilus]|uniref:FtsX-like permease family protein n=1 Tax=Peribacillus tepidiphilus TaxID=2652445 RepID=UPI00129251F0|nr:ABC transporter permease [Peribacillus tepidiphilus]
MSFNQIVWKMAKVHYKKYIFYFLCNSFAVMFFFMFSTVYFNERVVQVKKVESIQYVLTVPGVALVVFTVFFISYAHNVFIKRRRSELGLFMTLGMSNRDISKLLLLENGVIALFSIISGILTGTIFARLFYLLLMNSVGLHGVPFHFNSKMFVYSIITFLIVFFIAVGKSLFHTLKHNVIHSLKSDKVSETIKMKSPLIGGIGLAIMIGSVLGLYYTYSNSIAGGEYLFLWAMSTFIGLYISLYQFTSFFIELAKKYKPFYYRRLLFLTNLDYKFKQLTSILMLVTVMIMVTILYSTIILSTYILTEKQAIDGNPFDIAFIQAENKNNLALEELYSIVDQKENPIQKHLVIPIYSYYQKQTYSDWSFVYNFMSVDHFNQLTSNQLKLQDHEFLYYINDDPENAASGSNYDQGLTLPTRNGEVTYTLKKTIVKKNFNNLYNLYDCIIVSNSEFKILKDHLDGFESNIHLINVANWKNTTNTVEKLDRTLKSYNENTPPIVDVRTENATEEDLFRIASKVEDYNDNKNSNGILFFVTTFLSIIFFFGSFILLYLNLFSEIDKEKNKYKKLNNIGITAKEVKRIISREITALFFVPTIVGTTLAFLYIVAMATDIGGVSKNPEILLHFFIVAGIYHFIQVGFFLYARKRMFLHLTE